MDTSRRGIIGTWATLGLGLAAVGAGALRAAKDAQAPSAEFTQGKPYKPLTPEEEAAAQGLLPAVEPPRRDPNTVLQETTTTETRVAKPEPMKAEDHYKFGELEIKPGEAVDLTMDLEATNDLQNVVVDKGKYLTRAPRGFLKIPIAIPNVRQYINGRGWAQFKYNANPTENVAFISGDKDDKDRPRLMVLRCHAGIGNDGQELPGERLRRLHDRIYDPKTGTDRQRTPEEAAEFRKDFQAKVSMTWIDDSGEGHVQAARARMLHISREQNIKYKKDWLAYDANKQGTPKPHILDYVDPAERPNMTKDQWDRCAALEFCGQMLEGEPDKEAGWQDSLILFMEAIDENAPVPETGVRQGPSMRRE